MLQHRGEASIEAEGGSSEDPSSKGGKSISESRRSPAKRLSVLMRWRAGKLSHRFPRRGVEGHAGKGPGDEET